MDQLYSLRRNFAIIGLTGRSGSGCSSIAARLENQSYVNVIKARIDTSIETDNTEKLKLNICLDYLSHSHNWQPFHTIKYTHILFYQVLYEAFYNTNDDDEALDYLKTVVFTDNKFKLKRFSESEEDAKTIIDILKQTIEHTSGIFREYNCSTLEICLRDEEKDTFCDFFQNISPLAKQFYQILREINYSKTNLMIQDIACNLRSSGSAKYPSQETYISVDNIYIIAETINRLIKCFRQSTGNGKIVIDSLKNSLELTYFKERYAAFYCIATNKIEEERYGYKIDRIKQFDEKNALKHSRINTEIDNLEYKGGDFKKGDFSAPDIENCIQKSEYHIFYSENYNKYKDQLIGESAESVDIDIQLVKFLGLLFCPGLITPSAQERSMQIAYNAKSNSGCISRQVGAVITDKNHSVKAIGWNDVAKNQVPCNLRTAEHLINGKNKNHFSDFELGKTDNYKDGETFKEKFTEQIDIDNIQTKLDGRNCSFCFKSCHNSFEGKSNQVHTRSLHAEENAMLQITKFGGQGVEDGFLYTTASPCELCSKKAFQLGVKTIYFIDPYPGIATSHILKSGKASENNPKLLMFRGAVGRGYHKLYEGFMSYKDELNIRANFHPKESKKVLVERLTHNKELQSKILNLINE